MWLGQKKMKKENTNQKEAEQLKQPNWNGGKLEHLNVKQTKWCVPLNCALFTSLKTIFFPCCEECGAEKLYQQVVSTSKRRVRGAGSRLAVNKSCSIWKPKCCFCLLTAGKVNTGSPGVGTAVRWGDPEFVDTLCLWFVSPEPWMKMWNVTGIILWLFLIRTKCFLPYFAFTDRGNRESQQCLDLSGSERCISLFSLKW